MSHKPSSDGSNDEANGTHISSETLIHAMSWHHITALVNRLTREGLCEDRIVEALIEICPHYAPLIEETLKKGKDNAWQAGILTQVDSQEEHMFDTEVVQSQDGQWVCHYEYPRDTEPVQADDSPFIVQAAEHFAYCIDSDDQRVRCQHNPNTVLLRITGDCACVTAERGEVTPFGRSLGHNNGFFLVALKDGEAIRVTTHDHTQSMVYLFTDDFVNELDLDHWRDNFAPYLAPLD
jgi:hypothetical protein